MTSALNGADFDGDLCMLTDNHVLVSKHQYRPTLMCMQRRAMKCIPREEDFVRSNIESFGNDIGQTTNWITSMFEVQSKFEKGSPEYEMLGYRIKCGQHYQQNAIDKAKGIVCKPMPRSWHDRHAVNKIDNDEQRELYRNIVASRKPYFMRYIYPALMKEYNTYIKNTNMNALREFGITVNELESLPKEQLSERQAEFLKFYNYRMPVGTGDCVMNKICRRFEYAFDGYVGRHSKTTDFDYHIMYGNTDYTAKQRIAIQHLYEDYNKRIKNYAIFSKYERVNDFESASTLQVMNDEFRKECDLICPDKDALCNIVLDICYKRSSTKRFAWNMCGREIINNLLDSNDYEYKYPALDPDGDIVYGGERFSVKKKVEVID